MRDTEDKLREAAGRARAAQTRQTTTYVAEANARTPEQHATRDDVSRSKYVKTLCGRDIAISASTDARPALVCDACDAVIASEEREQQQ